MGVLIAVLEEMDRKFYSNDSKMLSASASLHQPQLPIADHLSHDGRDHFRDSLGIFAMSGAVFHAARGIMEAERDNLSALLPGMHRALELLSEVELP